MKLFEYYEMRAEESLLIQFLMRYLAVFITLCSRFSFHCRHEYDRKYIVEINERITSGLPISTLMYCWYYCIDRRVKVY